MFKKLIEKIKYFFSHDFCYKSMEHSGIAVFGLCRGLVGGDAATEYLQYDCIDCPYFYKNKRGDSK